MYLKLICRSILFFIAFFSEIIVCQPQKSLIELCNQSDEIIVAEITQIQSTFNSSNGRIISTIDLKIDEHLKSNYLKNAQEFQIIYPGGEFGNIIQIIPDAPRFKKNEKTVLFLKRRDAGEMKFFYVFGLSQGKFNIVKDVDNNEYVLRDSGQDYLQISPLITQDIIRFNTIEKKSKAGFISLIKSLL